MKLFQKEIITLNHDEMTTIRGAKGLFEKMQNVATDPNLIQYLIEINDLFEILEERSELE